MTYCPFKAANDASLTHPLCYIWNSKYKPDSLTENWTESPSLSESGWWILIRTKETEEITWTRPGTLLSTPETLHQGRQETIGHLRIHLPAELTDRHGSKYLPVSCLMDSNLLYWILRGSNLMFPWRFIFPRHVFVEAEFISFFYFRFVRRETVTVPSQLPGNSICLKRPKERAEITFSCALNTKLRNAL